MEAIFDSMDAPVVEDFVYPEREGQFFYKCPYCPDTLFPGDVHWHAFGPIPANCTYVFESPEPYPVDYCLVAFQNNPTCPYSGCLEGNETAIQVYMARYHVSHDVAAEMLVPRFHAHRVAYDLNGPNGGQLNQWHVGGEIPYWTPPIVPVPEP